ncbi:MAG TPA: alpha/beta fold hydrolase [Catenuloplanes sp.]|jgi:pimeloyl-ACP methyl ester carboxylesterase
MATDHRPEAAVRVDRRRVEANGLTFDVFAGGPADGAPVLLLHGFPQDSGEWDLLTPGLHRAGLRTYALDQRGYSPGARPAAVADYRMAHCVADVVAVLDALGVAAVHLVGHDWGALVAWQVAARHPERVRTLTAVSVPHPRAAVRALRHPSQLLRSSYIALFRRAGLAERLLLARGGAALRSMMRQAGPRRAERYAATMREPGRLTGGLNWYRAASLADLDDLGPVTVPTTYVWSTRDPALGPVGALRCGRYVTGGYRFVVLRGISHWIPDEAPDVLADVVLHRVGSVPA